MNISFTGTRYGMTDHQKNEVTKLVDELRPSVVSHGCCVGADIDFHKIVRKVMGRSTTIVVWPSTAKTRAPIPSDSDIVMDLLPPLIRNKRIVDTCQDKLIATPRTMTQLHRSGTWHAVRYAMRRKVPVKIVWPTDGYDI